MVLLVPLSSDRTAASARHRRLMGPRLKAQWATLLKRDGVSAANRYWRAACIGAGESQHRERRGCHERTGPALHQYDSHVVRRYGAEGRVRAPWLAHGRREPGLRAVDPPPPLQPEEPFLA